MDSTTIITRGQSTARPDCGIHGTMLSTAYHGHVINENGRSTRISMTASDSLRLANFPNEETFLRSPAGLGN